MFSGDFFPHFSQVVALVNQHAISLESWIYVLCVNGVKVKIE